MSITADLRPNPFSTLQAIDGYLVIATDTGREVERRESRAQANGVAVHLNQAAKAGPRALAAALNSRP
jgi:hypothetical protein